MPGAFSITSLQPKSAEEVLRVRELSRKVAMEMRELDGFMGWVGAVLGDRMVTITSWEAPEHAKQVMRLPSHREGTKGFFGTELAEGVWVSVWTPEHIGPVWARCGECGAMVDTGAEGGVCECGAALPEARPHW